MAIKIKEFIQTQVILKRLQQRGVLVVYDPQRRYRELCLELAGEGRVVVDAGESSITSRLAALEGLQALGRERGTVKELLVYVPAARPKSDEQKQRDPFWLYAECGAVFPEKDSDEYFQLCLKARAEHAAAVRQIFNHDPNPGFGVIDAIGGGTGWPTLQDRFQVEGGRDLLLRLITPSPAELQALSGGAAGTEAWAGEVRSLGLNALGLTFLTHSNSWEKLADELWRFVLFSEFVFDLPGAPEALPPALRNVPRAPEAVQTLVEDLCDTLRSDQRTRGLYIERAETVERELNLPEACQGIADLGVRDTFPFEERTCFRQAAEALKQDDLDGFRSRLERHDRSVWVGRGENQTQWLLLEAAGALAQACQDADEILPQALKSQQALIEAYLTGLRHVDRSQREFEQAYAELYNTGGWELGAAGEDVEAASVQVRAAYRKLMEKVQKAFVGQLERQGWPAAGRLSNTAVFDRLAAPHLQESGKHTALIWIDALRYELGVELYKQLGEEGQAELQAACAALPSVTPVGMAGLLPGAGELVLKRKDNDLAPHIGETPASSSTQRMDVLRKRYGQRFAEYSLVNFVKSKTAPAETVDLVVIRSNEMDEQFEQSAETGLALIGRTLQQARAAIHKLREWDFRQVVIATDHGFYLNIGAEAGDVCPRPPGTWITVHDRMLLGDGTSDAHSLALPLEELGMRGDFHQAALPRAMAAYRAGLSYFHGGASLQEAIVPVITVKLRQLEAKPAGQPEVTLSYKRDSRKITSRMPMVEVAVGFGGLFQQDAAVEMRLEAADAKGKVVGEAKVGGPVNPATHTLTVTAGQTVQVVLKMDESFEGRFQVRAVDPQTMKLLGKALELETDYTV